MSGIDISVVIVSYNVRSFLDHCLQSVQRASQGLTVQVIVVDNASSDDSAEMVKQRYSNVTLIANTENAGFARANNQAFELAQGEAVLILNPDSFVQEDTLRTLYRRLKELDDAGAIGPKILLPDGRFEPRSMRGFPTPWVAFSYLTGLSALFPKRRFFSRYLLTYLNPDEEQTVDALSGCCLMVRRKLLEELHGFDGDYFMYGEDLDLCYRISQKGYRILYCPATRIVHFKGESTRRSDIDQEFHFQRSMRLFVDKNLTAKVSGLSRGVITAGFWLRNLERSLYSLFSMVAAPILDVFILNLFIYLGRWIRFAEPGFGPEVWMANAIYSIFYVVSGLYFGAYGTKKFSGRIALYSAIVGAILASAFTYFFKQWAFSRFVVLWFAFWMVLAMPGWRILLRQLVQRKSKRTARFMIRRKALIVGTDSLGREIAKRVISNPTGELEPVGIIAFSQDGVGEVIEGVPVLGEIGDLDRIIQNEGIEEVVFSTGDISYDKIIELVQSLTHRSLNFKVIPGGGFAAGDDLPSLSLEMSSLGSLNRNSRTFKRLIFRR